METMVVTERQSTASSYKGTKERRSRRDIKICFGMKYNIKLLMNELEYKFVLKYKIS